MKHITKLSKECPSLQKLGLTTPEDFSPFLIPGIIKKFKNLKHLHLELGTLVDELVFNEIIQIPMKLMVS